MEMGKGQGKWGPIDQNFASDADIDAITALIIAYRRWNRPEYLELARTKLRDLWNFSTIAGSGNKRYLYLGQWKRLCLRHLPYTSILLILLLMRFRIFAQDDPDRKWLSLVESSYQVLDSLPKLLLLAYRVTGLPSTPKRVDSRQCHRLVSSKACIALMPTGFGAGGLGCGVVQST
jgi:hypothetical protein